MALEDAVNNEQFSKAEELKQELTKLREEMKNKENDLKGPVVMESQDEALVSCYLNLFLRNVNKKNLSSGTQND